MDGLSDRQLYLIVKDALRSGDDKKLLANLQAQRESGLGWRFDGLGDWTTAAIFEKLQSLGIRVDEDGFRVQAQSAGRTMTLTDAWRVGLAQADLWKDFPFVAAEELWRRLTPDLLCPELVADRLSQAMHPSPKQGPPLSDRTRLAAALWLVDYLERFPVEQRGREFEEVIDCGIHDYGGWLLDLVLDLGRRYPDEVTRLADCLSDCYEAANFQGDLAVALAEAGRREQALERARANLERFPNDVWIRIKSADVYKELENPERALDLAVEALAMACEPYDWDGAAERIADLLHTLGRSGEWEHIEERHPRPDPPNPWEGPAAGPQATVCPPNSKHVMKIAPSLYGIGAMGHGRQDVHSTLVEPALVAADYRTPKIGRNDSCPCGSGKKYKKCCL